MAKKVIVLGSTGSLGIQTLGILKKLRKDLEILAIFGGRNSKKIDQQGKNFATKAFTFSDENDKNFEKMLSSADIVINVLSGTVGIKPSLVTIETGKTLILGNKESLVAEGKKIMKTAKANQIIPLDSEHNAIYEILKKFPHKKIKQVIIPCSGGPFWNKTTTQLKTITPQDALNHPKWKMGPKISVESATLINKGLELVEAHFLFDLPFSKIKVALHPECKIHGAVEFTDGTRYAYLAEPDMKEHIENALLRAASLTLPKRKIVRIMRKLESDPKTLKEFPAHLPGIQIVLNAFKKKPRQMKKFLKKEEAVIDKFLNNKISFLKIFELLRE